MSYTQLTRDDNTTPAAGLDVDRPHPPAWKRAALVAVVAILFWLAFYLRPSTKPESKVVYASRYPLSFFPLDHAS